MKFHPIIQSLIDNDLYKFTMMQAVHHMYPEAEVEYRFHCRTPGVDLVPYMREIEEQIAAYCDLAFNDEELDVLGSLRFIKKSYVQFLKFFRPLMEYVKVVRSETISGAIDIIVAGPWQFTILFEVPILAIVQEIYSRSTCDVEEAMVRGKQILIDKFQTAESHPEFKTFHFSDFGTRRRFSREWHEEVVASVKSTNPIQLTGSSNVLLANKYKLATIGTQAHEWFMGHQQLGGRLRDSQKNALDAWANYYDGDLGIALTDVIGIRQFLPDFSLKHAKLWDGVRHDSGSPKVWADLVIDHYKSLRIDPLNKSLVFSDGLDIKDALDLQEYLSGRARGFYGIGTKFTNDVGHRPLNIVMKMTRCNGAPVAKISDSPGKSMCPDPEFEAYLAQVFNATHYQPK